MRIAIKNEAPFMFYVFINFKGILNEVAARYFYEDFMRKRTNDYDHPSVLVEAIYLNEVFIN